MGLLIIALVFLLAKGRKPDSGESDGDRVDVSGFLPAFYVWLAQKEGRLSDAAVDSELERSPCTVNQNGRIIRNPHTSRGVTWKTFKALSTPLGYEPTCDNFAAMSNNPPSNIWKQIVAHIFSKGLPYSKNPVLANYVGGWYWGTGSIGKEDQQTIQNILSRDTSDRTKLRELINHRKEFFRQVVVRKPHKRPALEGWLNRAESYWETFNKFV